MRISEARLRTLGEQIRARRVAANLTQDALGKRAGIVGKYVSEIERGTRDVPISTLMALVEHGLGLRLELIFMPRAPGGNGTGGGTTPDRSSAAIDEVARELAALSADERTRVISIIRGILALVGR